MLLLLGTAVFSHFRAYVFVKSVDLLCCLTELPQAPESLSVLEVNCCSVKLAWNSTSSVLAAPITSYLVQYRPNDSSNDYAETSVSKPEVLVDGLRADTTYLFSVLSVSEVGRSHSAASVIVTTTGANPTGLSVAFISSVVKI